MKARKGSLKDVVSTLKPGMTVFVPGMSGESQAFFRALAEASDHAAGVRFLGIHFPGVNANDYLALHPLAAQRAYFMQSHLRHAMRTGRAALMPLDYWGVLNDLKKQIIDVVVAQVSIPDANGAMSLGPSYDFLPAVWKTARVRIAHVNPRVHPTRGSFWIAVDECDMICESASPPVTYDHGNPLEDELDIGRHVSGIVRDGDTLQTGIGKLPSGILRALSSHRNLRIYSGMVTDAVLPLIDSGVISGERAIQAGVALGDEAFYRRVAEDTFYFRPVSETHDLRRMAAIPNFVSINAAVEIDLFGQVNCDRLDGRLLGGVGGMPAFVQGSQLSANGRAIFCLPSTAKHGSISRIVPLLGAGSLVGSPRYALDVVVTEHGIAHTRRLDMDARAQRLIQLAAPQFRESLAASWRELRARF